MYYFIMYGACILSIVGIMICGIYMLTVKETKIVLKPGQSRDKVIKQMRKQGKIYIIIGLVVLIVVGAVMISVWPYIPGINY